MRTSRGRSVSYDGVRGLGWLLQMVLGAVAGGLVVLLLAVFRVDVCGERWQVAPLVLLAAAALMMIPIIRHGATRLMFGTCALIVAGVAAWILYLGSALGCE
ncbi:MAG: hypothetical protein WEE64_09025 [Dehalococcoidia bacterium]